MTPTTDSDMLLNGQGQGPVAPPPRYTDDTFPEVNTPGWVLMNRRRFELIQKKHREGLLADEREEYDDLQRRTTAALEKAFPAPTKFDEELARILEELAARKAKGE